MTKAVGRRLIRSSIKRSATDLEQAVDACANLLVPITKQFSQEGIGISLFLHAAKCAYVRSSINEIKLAGQRPTVSRIAASTGLSRKEIKHLSTLPAHEGALERVSPIMKVVSAWREDRDFVSRDGNPRVLPLEGVRSFRELAKRHAGDVTPVAILRELTRLGWVQKLTAGKLKLSSRDCRNVRLIVAAEFANRLSGHAAALQRNASDDVAGFASLKLPNGKITALLAKDFSRRARNAIAATKRRAEQLMKSENGGASHSSLHLGFFLSDDVEAELREHRPPTRRAKRA